MAGFEDLPDADEQLPNEEVDEVQQVAGLMQARITQNCDGRRRRETVWRYCSLLAWFPQVKSSASRYPAVVEVRHLIAVRLPPLSAWRASQRSQSCLFPISSDTFDAFPYDLSQKI